MKIDAAGIYYQDLNDQIAKVGEKEIELDGICGQRFIGCGLSDRNITVNGTPGNGLGAYMNNSVIMVNGNAQDATGDTMNNGRVVICGNCGDTCGYAMRGGEIYIRGDAGYRAGIHMKQYGDMKPVIIIGGKAGDFLGEYLAGGVIVVLGLGAGEYPVGSFCGTGMHGGKIYIRSDKAPKGLPKQVNVGPLSGEDHAEIEGYVKNYCEYFGGCFEEIMGSSFVKLTPNSKNPYRQLYTNNW